MADESITTWAEDLVSHERRRFECARKRFARTPSPEHLHGLRTAARRLRSVLEDLGDIVDDKPIRKAIRPLIKATGTARDAAVIREALRNALSDDERKIVRPFLRELRITERRGRRKACNRARTMSLP